MKANKNEEKRGRDGTGEDKGGDGGGSGKGLIEDRWTV